MTKPAAKRKPPAKPPTLAVQVTGAASYVEVRLPNRTLLVGNTFGHGKRFTFTQPTLDVVIGDAGAVRLDINGVTRSPAGRPGQVLRFRVTARR